MRQFPGVIYKMTTHNNVYFEDVKEIERALASKGFLKQEYIDGYCDLFTENAVKSWQRSIGATATGWVSESNWNALFGDYDENKDTIDYDDTEDSKYYKDDNIYPGGTPNKYSEQATERPFFNEQNGKQLRKANIDIQIKFGANNSMNRTLKNVYMRSIGQQIGANGEPIYDLYEFVARDLIDSENTFEN